MQAVWDVVDRSLRQLFTIMMSHVNSQAGDAPAPTAKKELLLI